MNIYFSSFVYFVCATKFDGLELRTKNALFRRLSHEVSTASHHEKTPQLVSLAQSMRSFTKPPQMEEVCPRLTRSLSEIGSNKEYG